MNILRKIFPNLYKVKLREVYQWAIDSQYKEYLQNKFKYSSKIIEELYNENSPIFNQPIDNLSWLAESGLHWKVRHYIVYIINTYKEIHHV